MSHTNTAKSTRLSPEEVLDHHYLEIRLKALETAAIFDRFQRAGGGDPTRAADERLKACLQAIRILLEPSETPDRAERVALVFSDPE